MSDTKSDDDVFAFLLGEAPLEGLWFGDTTRRPAFWWRKHLRAALIELARARQDAEKWRAHMASEAYLLQKRQDDPCLECRGVGSVGFMQLRCRTCDGTGIDPFGKPMKEGT